MRAILTFAFISIKRFFRDPVALFFTLAFPLLFLFVFGSIFRGGGDVNFDVAIFNNSDTTFSREFVDGLTKEKTFTKVDAATLDDAREKMGRGELDSIIEIPSTFGQLNANQQPSGTLQVYFNEANPQGGQTVSTIIDSILADIGEKITGQMPLFTVEQRATTTTNLTQFDYIVSGLLGFAILSLGIFGLANQFPAEKKNGTLRRLQATPFTKGKLIIGTMIYYGFIGMLSLVVMLIVATNVLGFDMRGNWLQLGMFMALSVVMMLGFGLLIGGWAKNENQSAVISNAVAFPLMFLSGVFFPRFLMPEWLQGITGYLPLTPVVDGIRYITTENATLLDLGPQLAIMAVWIIGIYLLAVKLFRWQ